MQDTVDFLGTRKIPVVMWQMQTTALLTDVLKTSARTSVHSQSSCPGMLSSPAVVPGFSLHQVFLASALVRHTTWSLGGEVISKACIKAIQCIWQGGVPAAGLRCWLVVCN